MRARAPVAVTCALVTLSGCVGPFKSIEEDGAAKRAWSSALAQQRAR